MLHRLLQTDNNISWFLLRVTLGIVMLGHGLQKALGWFGGYGWDGTMNYFTDHVGIPYFLGALVILIESIGAVLLIIGFGGRFMAALMIIVMGSAFFIDHLPNGFFMNWFGNKKGEGVEFDILFIIIAIVLVINGSGKFSIDRKLSQ
ncbi:MAG: DoxX family protein [Chitinophagaceae bacterium]